ncbi:CoA-dependent acyltransferase [Dacryopinax primogenitus]|uniref:Dihydrolipoamide acetyltransferase component of pyruvate dehydrogenase complex n=1 Tax=Dacryopinax primogenitus (strain DJM 731) TaxID=1858805 RepID=M5FQD5_DACPD|nr:CoA-dependent acyltransferase [Dacryopinax primogenitus]EJT99090.1 CoA-dependent acyltransferase [Dacryopinax primogenitus]
MLRIHAHIRRRISSSSHLRALHLTTPTLVPRTFNLADIGEGITECEILRWHAAPSQRLLQFDPLCEVQSDKASVEITSPWEGRVMEVCVQEGGVVKVGGRLCVIDVDEPGVGTELKSDVVKESKPPVPTPPLLPQRQTYIPRSSPTPHLTTQREDILALPSVRHYAKEKGVDLSLLPPGTGRGGRTEKADIDRYLATASASTSSAPEVMEQKDEVVKLGRTRWAMYKSMTTSLQIPHFGYSTQLDLTELHHILPTLNASIPWQYLPSPPPQHAAVSPYAIYCSPPEPRPVDPLEEYERLTYLPFLVKALAYAMLEWPLFRSTVAPTSSPASLTTSSTTPASSSPTATDRPSLLVRPNADISLALSTPTGLYTPTLFAANQLSPYELQGRITRLARLGRTVPSQLSPAEFGRGGTIAVSNVGAIGSGSTAHPLLVPGIGLAIVVLGRAKWVDEVDPSGGELGQVRRRLKMDTSWAGDHRFVEGAEIAAFGETWRGWIEKPGRMVGAGR